MKNSTIVFIFFAVVIHFVVGSIIAGKQFVLDNFWYFRNISDLT